MPRHPLRFLSNSASSPNEIASMPMPGRTSCPVPSFSASDGFLKALPWRASRLRERHREMKNSRNVPPCARQRPGDPRDQTIQALKERNRGMPLRQTRTISAQENQSSRNCMPTRTTMC
jgi:hypothetical protein